MFLVRICAHGAKPVPGAWIRARCSGKKPPCAGVIDLSPGTALINLMYIPESSMASKALAGLDQTRRDFVNHLADRLCVLPPESLEDGKQVRSQMMLELQDRFSPEEAARISFTSADLIVSIALSIVNERHEASRRAKRLSMAVNVAVAVVAAVAVIAIILFFTQESPKPAKAEAKGETKAVAPTK